MNGRNALMTNLLTLPAGFRIRMTSMENESRKRMAATGCHSSGGRLRLQSAKRYPVRKWKVCKC